MVCNNIDVLCYSILDVVEALEFVILAAIAIPIGLAFLHAAQSELDAAKAVVQAARTRRRRRRAASARTAAVATIEAATRHQDRLLRDYDAEAERVVLCWLSGVWTQIHCVQVVARFPAVKCDPCEYAFLEAQVSHLEKNSHKFDFIKYIDLSTNKGF